MIPQDGQLAQCYGDGLEAAGKGSQTRQHAVHVSVHVHEIAKDRGVLRIDLRIGANASQIVGVLFRDATGTFYNDRWKPLFEGLSNVILSVSFVFLFSALFNEDFGIVGVIFATILTNLFICHIVEPYVLYKHAFQSSAKKHFIKNYVYIAIFIISLILLDMTLISISDPWIELVANGGISLAYSCSISAIIFLCDKNFRAYLKDYIFPALKNKLKRGK